MIKRSPQSMLPGLVAVALLSIAFGSCKAQPQSDIADSASTESENRSAPELSPLAPLSPELEQLLNKGTSLNPEKTVFLDTNKRRVLLRTQVACDSCMLEMLCCLEGTKEHESILWVRSNAWVLHTALLALKAKPGRPAVFSPEFQAPDGQLINIFANWVDESGKAQRCDIRSWMRHSVHRYFSAPLATPPAGVELPFLELRYDPFNKELLWFGPMSIEQREKLLKLSDKAEYQQAIGHFFDESQSRPMKADFVFAGSFHFRPDDDADQEIYAAESGFLICVANFSQAVIDVREASSASSGAQAYEAWPEKVPPLKTPVVLELVPAKKTEANPKALQNEPSDGTRR